MPELIAINAKGAQALTLPVLGTGAFSSVRLLSDSQVLKLTCCEATCELLSLRKLPSRLPRVYKKLGAVAKDSEGFTYYGFAIERLFTVDTWREQGRAVRLHHANSGHLPRLKAGILLDEVEQLAVLKKVFKALQPTPEDPKGNAAQVDFCLRMAGSVTNSLRTTFLFLAQFMRERAYCLDLVTEGNLLLDAYGKTRLGDPVSVGLFEATEGRAAKVHIGAALPVSQAGLSVTLERFASSFEDATRAKDVQRTLSTLGVESRLLTGESALTRYLEIPGFTVPRFAYPNLKENLSRNRYQEILFGL